MVFDVVKDEEKKSAKGVVQAKIEKKVKSDNNSFAKIVVNVFATHLNQQFKSQVVSAHNFRKLEIQQFKLFYEQMDIPRDKSEAVLFQGDFNIKLG